LVTAGLAGNAFRETEGLALEARAGFIPNGNNDRSHGTTALRLATHHVGASAAELVLLGGPDH
jgi:hypothetical protein